MLTTATQICDRQEGTAEENESVGITGKKRKWKGGTEAI